MRGMPVDHPPEQHLDRTRHRGYVVLCLGGVATFGTLAAMTPGPAAVPYVAAAALAAALLVAALLPHVTATRMDRLLGWAADLGALITTATLARNAGPFSAQSALILSMILILWCGVLPRRAAGLRALLLVAAVGVIAALRRPAEPVPVIALAFVALLVGQMASSGRSIREELREKTRYANLAMTDMLTGLLNRRALHGALNAYYAGPARARRADTLGVLLLDLDHFKSINDSYGHDVGDSVLQHVSGILRSCAGPDDQVARWGGEEFLMLVVTTERGDLAARATQVIDTLRAIHSGLPPVTVSIGVAHASEAADVDSLLRLADRRLYRAKRAGRDRVNKDTLIHPPDLTN